MEQAIAIVGVVIAGAILFVAIPTITIAEYLREIAQSLEWIEKILGRRDNE